MSDKFPKIIRSRIMSKIKGRNTKPELLVRSAIHKLGYRYSIKHRFRKLNFVPDLTFVSRKTVLFVDGCFWHGCSKCYKEPKSNRRYWLPKIERNRNRDNEQNRYLRKNGWNLIRVWEHEIINNPGKTIQKINKKLTSIKT